MAGNRWRFELFSFDFAIGAILFALVSAYTLGNLVPISVFPNI